MSPQFPAPLGVFLLLQIQSFTQDQPLNILSLTKNQNIRGAHRQPRTPMKPSALTVLPAQVIFFITSFIWTDTMYSIYCSLVTLCHPPTPTSIFTGGSPGATWQPPSHHYRVFGLWVFIDHFLLLNFCLHVLLHNFYHLTSCVDSDREHIIVPICWGLGNLKKTYISDHRLPIWAICLLMLEVPMFDYSDKLAHIQVVINCRYSVAQMCNCEDIANRLLLVKCYDKKLV